MRRLWVTCLAAVALGCGRLVIVDFRLESERGPPREHKVAPETVRAELASAGYRLLEQHDFLADQYVLVFGVAP
jgi:hypothetical protein